MKDQITSKNSQQETQKPSKFVGGWDEELVAPGTTFHGGNSDEELISDVSFHGGYSDEELVGDVTFHMTDWEKTLREDMQNHYDAIAEIRKRQMRSDISNAEAESQVESRLRSIGYIKQELRSKGIYD